MHRILIGGVQKANLYQFISYQHDLAQIAQGLPILFQSSKNPMLFEKGGS